MDYFKIECQGAFKVDRGNLLVGSVHDTVRSQDADIVLVSSDGDIIPTHRCVLGLYSRTLPDMVDSVPCCQNVAVSVPFHSNTISSLLKMITNGISDPVDQKSLASLTECAQVLGITLSGLEIVEKKKNVVTLEVRDGLDLKSMLLQNGGNVTTADPAILAAKIKARGSTGAAKRKSTKPRPLDPSKGPAQRYSEDDIIEITPEMYAATGNLHTDIAEPEEDFMPHHFLMQGSDPLKDSSAGWGAMHIDENSWDLNDPKNRPLGHGGFDKGEVEPAVDASPEVEEIPNPDDPNSNVYTCSFCPGQYFKKRNDINRHLKKHVPIEMRKRFQCEGCKEKFINNSNLKVHMKVCTGKVREFPCKKCREIHYNKTDHLEHMARAHNVVKKHGCPICHKQLKKTSDLKKHMATHSNQKPFSCEVCQKKFKTESYVKVHMKSHFPDSEIPAHLLEQLVAQQAAIAILTGSPKKMLAIGGRSDSLDDVRSPSSEGLHTEALQDSGSEQNGKDMEDDDEGELIIEEDDIVTDDHNTSAQMEYDDVTDSPANLHIDEAEEEENGANGNENDGDGDETKLNTPLQEIYPKKDLYVSQISRLRSPEIGTD